MSVCVCAHRADKRITLHSYCWRSVHLSVPLLPSSLVLESRVKKNELRMRTVSLLSAGRLSHRYLSHVGQGEGGAG